MAGTQFGPERPVQPGAPTTESSMTERVVLMCASALFAGLTRQQCSEIASCAKARVFARDELLFMQGQPVGNLVLIQTGSVKLTQLSPDGNEVILWMNGSGDAVGIRGERANCGHTCSARVVEKCSALTWEYSRLRNLLAEYPQIRNNINRILSDRLRELEERFREVATERVAKRLALELLRLLKQVGRERRGGVEISLSREELAQMTGTTLFTISRILSRWSEQGFVRSRREVVVVHDVQMLKAVGSEL